MTSQQCYDKMKRRLTGRENKFKRASQLHRTDPTSRELIVELKKAAQNLIDEVNFANGQFDLYGWPDQWSRWERAKDDAMFTLQRFPNVPIK